MNAFGATALAIWIALIAASAAVWWMSERGNRPLLARPSLLVGIIAAEVLITGAVALLAAIGGPLGAPWSWLAVGVAVTAAGVTGGTVTLTVLALADASNRPGTTRVQRTVLRGGAWIGAPRTPGDVRHTAGRLARRAGRHRRRQGLRPLPGTEHRPGDRGDRGFIIGTFTSLGWAAVCAGIATIF